DEQPAGRADVAGDVAGDDEDARADHGAGDERGGVEQAELLLEAGRRRLAGRGALARRVGGADGLVPGGVGRLGLAFAHGFLIPSTGAPAGETPCLVISPRSSIPSRLWRRPYRK